MFTTTTKYSFSFLVWLSLLLLLHTSNLQVDAATIDTTTRSSSKIKTTKSTAKDISVGTKIVPSYDSNNCTITYGDDGDSIVTVNLTRLARRDGLPRYDASFEVHIRDLMTSVFNYSYNPCQAYSLPRHNPHDNFGDGCHNAIVCKYTDSPRSPDHHFYYTLGIESSEKVSAEGWRGPDNGTRISLVYHGIKSLRFVKTVITLVCDPSRLSPAEGLFKIIADDGRNTVFAELHHLCCCPGGCVESPGDGQSGDGRGGQSSGDGRSGGSGSRGGVGGNAGRTDKLKEKEEEGSGSNGEMMLAIVGTVVGLILSVVLIGGLCYVKRTHIQFYSKLPGVRSHTATGGGGGVDGKTHTDFRDYEPAAMAGVRHKLLPILEDSCIHSSMVEMGKRLGGGIFGDTHLGRFNGMTVTVKRFTLSIHLDQLTPEMMERMREEVSWISRQRHKNIVSVMGLSLDGRLPFLMTEYVLGECLKNFLKSNGLMLTWPQRVRMCQQVAEGLSFLHNTKPPVVHRDLRCGNLFISDNDLVKVADFSLTKLLQPMREQCDTDDCSCNRLMSACPATIRWAAPEMLQSPRAKEGESSTISTACDVYSFGLVLWEMVMVRDPFHEIKTETEVIEVVKNGGRPDTAANTNMLAPYKALMKMCWDQRPSLRPQSKQVAVRLKEMIGAARTHQRQISNRNGVQKSQENVMAL